MIGPGSDRVASYATLWDWRRQVTELYAEIRGTVDPEAAWRLWRDRRDRLFAEHPQTPLDPSPDFDGLACFPYDSRLRFEVEIEAPADVAPVPVPAGADGTTVLLPFARTRGLARPLGGEIVLYWIAGYGGGVFLPFGDATNGVTTYAGGRYLLDTIKGADLGTRNGRVVLDFNFAYNPSCSYSDRWVCPLSPPTNRLPEPVAAGERLRSASIPG
jgi:uncharacterized protein